VPMSKGLKTTVLVGAIAFVALFLVTTFAPPSRVDAAKYFSPEEIDRGLEFSFQRRLLYWSGAGLHLAVLVYIVFSGFARKLADVLSFWAGGRWLATVLLVGGFCFVVEEAISLPIALARLEIVRAWGLTKRPVADWLKDHAIGLGLSAVIEALILTGLYLLIRFCPRLWWALAALAGMLLAFAYAFILPVLIAPLFNTFTPLTQTKWTYLQDSVQILARRAEIPIQEILVADASRQGSHTNAYFTGFGSTQRIVLFDTLLLSHTRITPEMSAGLVGLLAAPAGTGSLQGSLFLQEIETRSQEELESILAHEMGHRLHNHIVKGIGLATLAALAGFYVLKRILLWAVDRPPFQLKSAWDPAGVPFIFLLFTVGSWLVSPVEYAISRHFERQADMVSLNLTRRPDVFIAAEKKLARDNISNVAPPLVSVWFFNTHPPAVERIQMAEQWKKDHAMPQSRKE